jgi:hypothetical protein
MSKEFIFPDEDSLVAGGTLVDDVIAYLEISALPYTTSYSTRARGHSTHQSAGKVYLPAPDVMIDSNNQVYQAAPSQVNPLIKSSDEWKNIAVNTSAEIGGAAIGAIAGQALIPIPGVGAFVGGVVGGVLTSLLTSEEASRMAENLLHSSGAMAINDLDNVFSAQSMKSYSFSWNLVPRNEKEAETVQDICYMLRNFSYPGTKDATDTRYYMKEVKHPYLFYLKLKSNSFFSDKDLMKSFFFETRPCVLNSVNIQTSVDRFRFTTSGKPPIVRLDLVFSELEPAFASHHAHDDALVSRSEIRRGGKK